MKNYDAMTFAELCEEAGYTPRNRPLTTEEVAELFSVTPHTLHQNRSDDAGLLPPGRKMPNSRRRLYLERDVLLYLLKLDENAAA